jgi:hypothetical protein
VNFSLAVLFVLLLQTGGPAPSPAAQQYFRYHRSVLAAPGRGETCSVIDPAIFPNAAPSLKDLRLYENGREIPYAVTLSEPQQPDSDGAQVLHLGMHGGAVEFDLGMPARSYTDVALDLEGKDYLATAVVSGMDSPGGAATRLGEFTLFDLSSKHLSHDTTLHLQESSYRFLHVAITAVPVPEGGAFVGTPEMVRGATVPPSREAQTIFTPAITLGDIRQHGHQTIADGLLPARLPIERMSFVLDPSYNGNFSRVVHITAHAGEASPEMASGTILRVHLTEQGHEIREQRVSIPAVLGANLQEGARVEVAVDNGDDAPLPITAILLEMRQRKLCFDATSAPSPELFYGDPTLPAPQYDVARLFSASARVVSARLGPEQRNLAYRVRPDTRSMTERHPDLIWAGLLVIVCLLALVALRSSKTLPR